MKLLPTSASATASSDWFTGDVWLDPIAGPQNADQRMRATLVRFAPSARTAWHSHARGQTLHIVHGVAFFGNRAGLVIRAAQGDTVYAEPGEEHWHAAAPDRFMEHLALIEDADDPADTTTWLEQVSDAEYAEAVARAESPARR